MSQTYDAIVIGTGGFGSSCLYHLARRGLKVLGLDRFPAAHDRGSSHGETRIIRQAYFEHPDYVPLLLRAYELWRELEAASGQELMTLCGLLIAGPSTGVTIGGARKAAELHGLAIENPEPASFAARFPGFRIPERFETVFEPDGGFLQVEACVRAHLDLAVQAGAEYRSGCAVVGWSADGNTVRVQTEDETFEAGRLVLTPGAWAGGLLAGLPEAAALTVRRKVLTWHPVRSSAYDLDRGGCGFFFEMPAGAFYGFPSLDGARLKVAEHTGGEAVDDPLQVDRSLRDSDVAPIAQFLEEVMPDVDPQPAAHSVCMYTMTPDEHFVIDRSPVCENVVFAAGFSGHGFKFTSVIGKAVAELAAEGGTELPIGFLSLERFRQPG